MVNRKPGVAKRKREKEWDPNVSDSNDETYNDAEAVAPRSARKTTKTSRGKKPQSSKPRRKKNSYSDDDDDDDDDDESDGISEISEEEAEESSEEDAPTNRSGRPLRKAVAKKHITYEESDPDEIKDEIEGSEMPEQVQEHSKIVKLKLTHSAALSQTTTTTTTITQNTRRATRASSKEPMAATYTATRPTSSGRSTRGTSAGASAGQPQRPARNTRQTSAGPGKGRQGSVELNPLGRRSSRLHPELEAEESQMKLTNMELVKPGSKHPSTVQEEDEENSWELKELPIAGDMPRPPVETSTEAVYGGSTETIDVDGDDQDAPGEADEGAFTVHYPPPPAQDVQEVDADHEVDADYEIDDAEEEEDEDELPTQRSRRKQFITDPPPATTPSPRKAKAPSTVSPAKSKKSPAKNRRAPAMGSLEIPRRSTRGGSRGGSQTKGSEDDDWKADDNGSDSDEMSGSDTSQIGKSTKKPFIVDDDDGDDYSEHGGRRSTRNTGSRGGGVTKRKRNISDEEDLAEEVADLQDSPGTRKSKRRNAAKEDTGPRKPQLRERTAKVDYRIINPEFQTFGDDMLQTPISGPGVGGGRKGGAAAAGPTLYGTSGPFGGWGSAAPIFGRTPFMGPAVDSDSSDDEEQLRARGTGGAGAGQSGSTMPNMLPPTALTNPGVTSVDALGAGNSTGKKSNADADPVGIDQSVSFDSVGGHEEHIRQLREMVALPLMYPEIFKEFGITPPKGVLFHGPPGTGKTLMARALASSCSTQTGKKVTFFMRKGADCLSKWVGEAERQLRLLFEEAKNSQPSIIFFDEIDGLAPVRSAKQDQIHASIVSTLLALMDGMDGRGQIIVIGATNRPDSVDPALRRPGRFDREFYFPLPDVDGRLKIIDIHTKNWTPPLSDEFKKELAVQTKGFGGADIRGMCTEAALNAVQRVYPQLYTSWDKFLINPKKIQIVAADFLKAIKKIVPSSERSTSSGASPLPPHVAPLLQEPLAGIEKVVRKLLPSNKRMTILEEAMYEDDNDPVKGFEREKMMTDFESARVFRPRLLIHGPSGMGQQYLGGALLHHFEGFHVQNFDMATLQSDPMRSPESAVIQYFVEVKRHKPSVIFIPNMDSWYLTMGAHVIDTFIGLLRSIPPSDPIMLVGIVETPIDELDDRMLKTFFGYSKTNRFELKHPSRVAREAYFKPLASHIKKSPRDFPDPSSRPKRVLEILEKAPPPPPHVPTPEELEAQARRDGQIRNWLRIGLMGWIDQSKQRYRKLKKPVIDHQLLLDLGKEPEPPSTEIVVSDIAAPVHRPYEISADKHGAPMVLEVDTGKKYYNIDVDIIEVRISNGYYCLPRQFLEDVKLIAMDAQTLATDKERILRANEMVANAEVYVTDLETKDPNWLADCEKLYNRQLEKQRQKEARRAAKEAKKASEAAAAIHAASAAVAVAEGSASHRSSNGISNGGSPRKGGSPSKPAAVPSILFPNPSVKQIEGSGSSSTPLTNGASHTSHSGDSHPQQPETHDVEMSNSGSSNGSYSTSAFHTAPPSSHPTYNQLVHGDSPAQAGGALPRNPMDAIFDSPVSSRLSSQRTSGGHSAFTQSTNGGRYSLGSTQGGTPSFHEFDGISSGDSQLPDTQVLCSSDTSQPANPSQQTSNNSYQTTQSLSGPTTTTTNNSGGDSQFKVPDMRLLVDIPAVDAFPSELATRTSGFSVEQLEQVNAALMETVWTMRGQWDRDLVLREVKETLADVLDDIGQMQPPTLGSLQISEEGEEGEED